MGNKYILDWEVYAGLARQAAAEGAVLLKNDNDALPLRKGEKISVFGRIQLDYYKCGSGSGGLVNTKYTVGILEALEKEKDITVNEKLVKTYREWVKEHPFDKGSGWAAEPWSQQEMPLDDALVEEAAAASDAAVVIIGRMAGEDRDALNEKGSYLLADLEEEMLSRVCKSFERVIVVLNVGNIIFMDWVKRYQPQAVMYVWQGGMEGGNAAADVLLGRMSPSGKLTDTISERLEDYPSFGNFGGDAGNQYKEDVYVGYRYFETFAREKVLYPFGYGMSYTSFDVFCQNMKRQECRTEFTVRVKNTGSVLGKEVVQVYLEPAQGKLGKPCRNLCAYQKTKLLEPGEVQNIRMVVLDERISSYDDSGITGNKSCYILEKGTYRFYVGTDVRSAKQVGYFEQDKTVVTEKCTESLSPVTAFERIKAVTGEDGRIQIGREMVPLRTYDIKKRQEEFQPKELPFTGDQGYKLGDVYDGKVSLDDFVSQMSDGELCGIVRGEGMCSPKVTPGTAAAFGGVTNALKGYGIPCGCCADGPSGIRMDCGTQAFGLPAGTCIACTFNRELTEQLFRMVGLELRKNRIDTLLGPGMNIHRNPLNGRNFEYFSEDPYLTGTIAAAELAGLHHYGVTGTIKHFVANNQEHNRMKYNSEVSERALREIYLRGFEIAVKEGGAYSLMTSYGAVNGIHTAGNYDLLTIILRKEWGFGGVVMTDWWAAINEEGEPASRVNLAAMVQAQNDLYMVVKDASKYQDNLKEALENGSLKRAFLQQSAKNICGALLRFPVMERSLGRITEEEEKAYESMGCDELPDDKMTYYNLEKELVIDGAKINTKQGASFQFGLLHSGIGFYQMRLRVKVNAVELAQVPVSIFVNGKVAGTITVNGTGGEWTEVEQNLGIMMNAAEYLRLYFAQGGMQIDMITIWQAQEFTLPVQ